MVANKDNKKGTLRRRPIKVTTIGDGTVGKTCLLITYTTNEFPPDYEPTVFDNYAGNICVDGQDYDMTLWDTAGQEDYDRIRPLSYPNTDCFLICFSVDSHSSFDNIINKWHPEIKLHCPHAQVVLVGTKGDLRENSSIEVVTPEECNKMRKKIKAYKYVECSAIKHEGLQEVFSEAIRSVLKKPSRKLCCIG